jgi:ferritin
MARSNDVTRPLKSGLFVRYKSHHIADVPTAQTTYRNKKLIKLEDIMSQIKTDENIALINKELENAINKQIGSEFQAKLQYLNIATYFDAEDLPQLAAFFYQQAQDEDMHAMKFQNYLVDAGGQVHIPTIPEPVSDFDTAEEAVQLALQNEVRVTGQINALMDLAIAQKDHIAQDFLRWFVTEQLEEVSTMRTLLNTVHRAGDNLLWVEDFLSRNPLGLAADQPAALAA